MALKALERLQLPCYELTGAETHDWHRLDRHGALKEVHIAAVIADSCHLSKVSNLCCVPKLASLGIETTYLSQVAFLEL